MDNSAYKGKMSIKEIKAILFPTKPDGTYEPSTYRLMLLYDYYIVIERLPEELLAYFISNGETTQIETAILAVRDSFGEDAFYSKIVMLNALVAQQKKLCGDIEDRHEEYTIPEQQLIYAKALYKKFSLMVEKYPDWVITFVSHSRLALLNAEYPKVSSVDEALEHLNQSFYDFMDRLEDAISEIFRLNAEGDDDDWDEED
jgi:hypothetical protein